MGVYDSTLSLYTRLLHCDVGELTQAMFRSLVVPDKG